MSPTGISLRGLTRSFDGRPVLRGVTLDIGPGEVFTLTGANGCGKTTLIEILATLLDPSGGAASVLGFDVRTDAAAVRRRIGYAPSTLESFYSRLTGAQNLRFFGALQGLTAAEQRRRAAVLLEQFGLLDAASVRVERYSDGMRARLTLARALLVDPPVLLVDEPTRSIDASSRRPIRDLLLSPTRSGGARTVLWVTHDLTEAAEIGHRTGELVDGRIVERTRRLVGTRSQAVSA
jgi:ABC-2 type transport system ATP-binding protein